MKNIAYIELDTHAELAINFIELTRDSQYLHVEYFFSRKILDRINEKGSHVIHAEAATLLKELDGRKFDAVIIGTAHRYFNVFEEVARNYPTFIIAHNLNFIKASKADIFRNIFKQDRSFRIKLWLKEGLMKKDKLYSEARSLFILDENIDELQYPYELRWLPLLYTKHSEQKIQTNLVAIPGTVDQHRRNYKRIFNKIKYFRGNFTFSFFRKGRRKKSWISCKEYRRICRIMLILNTTIQEFLMKNLKERCKLQRYCGALYKKETRFFGITEIYGKTKMSGNIGDAIKYAKPAIFPKSYSASYSFIFKEKKRY